MFPGALDVVVRNEAGEVLGWETPGEPEYDPDDYLAGYDDDLDDVAMEDWDDDDGFNDNPAYGYSMDNFNSTDGMV